MRFPTQAFDRIRELLTEQAKTDGAAAQDLREWEEFLETASCIGQPEFMAGRLCEECLDRQDDRAPMVCVGCYDILEAKLDAAEKKAKEEPARA